MRMLMIPMTDKVIPRQLFEVPIQAAVGKRVIARETLSAMRADVTAGLYGGKLLARDIGNPSAHGSQCHLQATMSAR